MSPHLLRCQGIGVGDYTLALGRLVGAKRKSRRRGSWDTLDFHSFRVIHSVIVLQNKSEPVSMASENRQIV